MRDDTTPRLRDLFYEPEARVVSLHYCRARPARGTHNLPFPDVDDDVKAISRNLYAEYSAIYRVSHG